jgi:hypothetical protein
MADDPKTDTPQSDDHPLASPTELAGSTEGAIAAEFAARDAEDALDAADQARGVAASEENPLDGE